MFSKGNETSLNSAPQTRRETERKPKWKEKFERGCVESAHREKSRREREGGGGKRREGDKKNAQNFMRVERRSSLALDFRAKKSKNLWRLCMRWAVLYISD